MKNRALLTALATVVFHLFGFCSDGFSDRLPIIIDGQFSDWEDAPIAYTDQSGDAFGGIDFGEIRLADDNEFLFLSFEFDGEVDASENNGLLMYIDTDFNSSTGLSIGGIGAELEWNFNSRFGLARLDGGETFVEQNDIGFRGGPTITSSRFEFAIRLDSIPDGVNPLFPGSQIRIFLSDNTGGDIAPELGQFVNYEIGVGELPDETTIPLDRQSSSDLRLVTHNVLFDSPWAPGSEARFGRQWAAVSPDILNFQEIFEHTAAETIDLVDNWVNAEPGQTWQAARHSDCVTVSRFPILNSWPIDGNLATLIDTTQKLGSPILIINAHLPCCDNDGARQNEANQIMAFIYDARNAGGNVDIANGTPIIITGDLNLVGLSQQLTTLLSGFITNPNVGPIFEPDWDDTDFTNLITRQTERRMGYTWRNDFSSFWPGHLDFVIYSDSVIEAANHYVLYTPEISDPQSMGLQADDSLSSDHLLFCSDFRNKQKVLLGDVNQDGVVNLLDVEPFVSLLGSGQFQAEGDINGDGAVNLLDVGLFVTILGGG